MTQSFADWLVSRIGHKGWTRAEFCRRAQISDTALSLVVSGHRSPGVQFCEGVARAFDDITPEEAMRKAGLLPDLPGPESDWKIRRVMDIMLRLSPEERKRVLEHTEWRYEEFQKSAAATDN
jgi:transcriptional regulator with XRE-family HTH domain